MSRRPSQTAALQSYREARDIEAGLLAREGINPWRVLAGVAIGAAGIALCGALWIGLVSLFGMRWGA